MGTEIDNKSTVVADFKYIDLIIRYKICSGKIRHKIRIQFVLSVKVLNI